MTTDVGSPLYQPWRSNLNGGGATPVSRWSGVAPSLASAAGGYGSSVLPGGATLGAAPQPAVTPATLAAAIPRATNVTPAAPQMGIFGQQTMRTPQGGIYGV